MKNNFFNQHVEMKKTRGLSCGNETAFLSDFDSLTAPLGAQFATEIGRVLLYRFWRNIQLTSNFFI